MKQIPLQMAEGTRIGTLEITEKACEQLAYFMAEGITFELRGSGREVWPNKPELRSVTIKPVPAIPAREEVAT